MLRATRALAIAIVGSAMAAGSARTLAPTQATSAHVADSNNIVLVSLGKRIYAARCASCHGRTLQGQPLWQLADADSRRRAPALNQTGHAWLKNDDDFFQATRLNRTATSTLNDGEIIAAVAFIKASWPVALRVVQAQLNPGSSGMPTHAAQSAWTFPANCLSRKR